MHFNNFMINNTIMFILIFSIPQVFAKDWWGSKLSDQPENFIVGYGSLINTKSRNSTAIKPIDAIPVRVSASFGYIRAWVHCSDSGFTALGLRKPHHGEQAMTINGVLYPVKGNDMSLFDQREAGYKRIELSRDIIEPVSWQQLPTQGKIWIYVSVGKNGKLGENLPSASAKYPLLQSYIDVVLTGGLEYGLESDFAQELIETTKDWSSYWLNDRMVPRRPWVFEKDAAKIDNLLKINLPSGIYLKDRMFPVDYHRNMQSSAVP